MKTIFVIAAMLVALTASLGCSRTNQVTYKDAVKKALAQADLTDVTVSEDADKNTITLGGNVHSENAKQRAGEVAQAAAGNRIVANQISVEPAGQASQARSIESNTDGAIEKNFKAALIAKGLDKQDIRYSAKNGVLTLTGTAKTSEQRQLAQQIAANIPNVSQVINEIQVR
ncbi:MAG: BON domain-containing protein [Acidobacteria bacterium]|nr:BON domain-containing protein [Acidobacteriota bacterium]MBV9483954.1 BON domain-containing protein [Acidobacteriota bacterium]